MIGETMQESNAEQSLEELEEETFKETDTVEFPPSDIIAYNELRSCADLFRMYKSGTLEIRPDFQREIVWRQPEQTRFIDSLIKQLPIPSMCFSLDYKTEKWQVIDGLQRMWTIVQFLDGADWALSRLSDVDPLIAGRSLPDFQNAESGLRQFYSRIENVSLPITVIRCDYSKKSHINYLFTIFHRLNTGGAKLNNQEIRNCIFAGRLNELLQELSRHPTWLQINGRKSPEGDRYRGQEQILRFFAFQDTYQDYGGRLANFLNDYMRDNQNPDYSFLEQKRVTFERTINVFDRSVDADGTRSRMALSVMEAVLVGMSLNLSRLEEMPGVSIREMYETLLTLDEFSEQRLREGLAARQRVQERLTAAVRIFSGNGHG